jgi:two-component system response regulator PilR (NtrC family)
MQELKASIAKFARSQAPVFVRGASGTGKELVARQIHLQGARADAPFIAVNCGAIPSELMESEFFGHLKGSFTGATSDNEGLFKAAHGGTLFLDEIADLPLAMQVKLLRVIQEKSIRAVGAQHEELIDVRIISASHRDLDPMVADGSFRQDLYYRINVIGINVPDLSERREDIPQLVDYLIEKHNYHNSARVSIDDEALAALADERITAADLQLPESGPGSEAQAPSLDELTRDLERGHIVNALEENRWNQSATARALGITLRQLRYRMDKWDLKQ